MAKTKESFKTSLTDSSQTLHLFPGSRFFDFPSNVIEI